MALFAFLQAEFPWALGPSDGRHVLRGADHEPEHIVVLSTLGAAQRRLLGRRGAPPSAEAMPVATSRATVIEARALADEPRAQAWLAGLDAERAAAGALSVLNRMLFAQRIASADPWMHEVATEQALILRAGWGEGDQVAEGRWREARELVLGQRRMRRTAALRPQERLAVLLSGRGRALVAEELALRARLDVDQGRLRHAALELGGAYATGVGELEAEGRADLAERVAELQRLAPGVQAAARSAGAGGPPGPDAAVVDHALARLEAALRARTASGFSRTAPAGRVESGA